MRDLQAYRTIALGAVDEAAELFQTHIGAAPALFKGEGDFATEADLAIESLLRKRLTDATGIPVFGEEHGGDLNAEACWVLDPIDGTSNYSCGNPMCAILVALLIDGQPVVAVTDMPLLGHRMHAIEGSPSCLTATRFLRFRKALTRERPLRRWGWQLSGRTTVPRSQQTVDFRLLAASQPLRCGHA